MVSDRAFIFHVFIPCGKTFSFSTKVKVICQGKISRSHFFNIIQKSNLSVIFYFDAIMNGQKQIHMTKTDTYDKSRHI